MKKIRINRAKWRTGDGSIYSTGIGESLLVNSDYNKCCLGFITCQVSKRKLDDILELGMPMELDFHVKYLNKEKELYSMSDYKYMDTDLSQKAQLINDSPDTTPQEKELAIKELFKYTYDIEFFGEFNYTPESEKLIDEFSEKEKKYLKDHVWSKL